MRILILTPRLPWPAMDGGRIAMARLARSLADCGADVRILSLNPRKHHAPIEAAEMPLQSVDINTSRLIGPALASLSGDAPFIVSRFISRRFLAQLMELLQDFRPDVVQIESPFLLPYVNAIRSASKARIVLRSLNVEFRIWEELARNARNPFLRFALRRVASSLKKYELSHLDTTDALIPISTADADDFRELGTTRPMHVVPCGVGLPPLVRSEVEEGTVGFIGSLDFRPNQEAVEWIVARLWPRILKRAPEARLSIAGSSSPAWLTRFALANGVVLQSDVPDAQKFMQRMSVLIAPLFAGGGMRIKVLEAMALARPIVATTRGAGGVNVTPGHDIVIADDVDDFADSVVHLLRDARAARAMGEAARETVARRYSSDAIGCDLLRFYGEL